MLNKQKGNMYGFVTHTWNAIKGKCSHNCSYCYMKVFPQRELHLDEKEFKTDLGEGNVIFVGSSTDMFAEDVNLDWIERVLSHCNKYPNNTYLFQTKNPHRFLYFIGLYPKNVIFGITLETNRKNSYSNTISPKEKIYFFNDKRLQRKMITIEPVIDFDLEEFTEMIKKCNPDFVNIGADSKNHNLPEPSKEKVLLLIKELSKFTNIINKKNLSRLIK